MEPRRAMGKMLAWQQGVLPSTCSSVPVLEALLELRVLLLGESRSLLHILQRGDCYFLFSQEFGFFSPAGFLWGDMWGVLAGLVPELG